MEGAIETLTELHEALLHEEANAEKAEVEELLRTLSLQELADAGVALPRLVITDISSGLYGRTIVTFTPKRTVLERLHGNGNANLQEQQQHRLSPGDIVGVFPYDRPINGSSSAVGTGVVHKVHAVGLSVAFDEDDGEGWLQQHGSVPDDSGCSLGLVYSLCLVSSEVTINRQRNALQALRNQTAESPANRIIAVCFDNANPRFIPLQLAESLASGGLHRPPDMHAAGEIAATEKGVVYRDWKALELSPEVIKGNCLGRAWFCETLTDSQRRAVFLSLLSQDVALIHGPPGTGKTTTAVEVLLQLSAAGFRVLACAPSNIAVDNMLERCFTVAKKHQDPHLLKQVKRCVRIGHPARVDEQLSGFCVDRHLNSDSSGIIRGLKASLDTSLRELNVLKRHKTPQQQAGGGNDSVKRELRAEVKRLRKDMRILQKKSVLEALQAAPIVFTTCAGAADMSLQNLVRGQEARGGEPEMQGMPFDVVVIDEAGQALEASCWIPLLLSKRCVLAGDHMQLPPTVRSSEALKRGLGISLFERLMRLLEDRAAEQLVCQFRMHRHIMAWSNAMFYKDSLVAAECVENRLLCDTYPSIPADTVPSILWIDTAGIPWLREDDEEAGCPSAVRGLYKSRSNRAEAALVMKYLQDLIENSGVTPSDIGVITPYAAQAKLIRRLLLSSEIQGGTGLLENLTVQTVDGFQGREREVIIISLVRSNHRREIGFLADARRLNVAVTRARSHLVIIGDSETVTGGSCAKPEGLSSENDAAVPPSEPKSQPTGTAAVHHGKPTDDVVDARKALTALFEMASSCGDLRVPYEYISASDVPAVDDHRPSGRADKKECSTAGDRRAVNPQTARSSKMPAKSNSKASQNRRQKVATAAAANAACEVSCTQDNDAFVKATRETLEALLRRSDAAKKRGGRTEEFSSGSLVHAFPPSLTSYHRLIVHQLAEELRLEHVSRGEGAERFIEVGLRSQHAHEHLSREPSPAAEALNDPQTPTPIQQHIETPMQKLQTSPSAGVNSYQQGSAYKPINLYAEQGSAYKPTPSEKPVAASKRSEKSKKLGRAAAATRDESEDIDALLKQHVLESKKCGFAGCKDSTDLMGRTCPYCRSRFCIKHAQPEIHGCGEAAAAEAKKAFRKQYTNNIRLITCAKDGTLGTRAATIAGTPFLNPSVGSNTQMREVLKNNLRKSIEGKARERGPKKETKKKS